MMPKIAQNHDAFKFWILATWAMFVLVFSVFMWCADAYAKRRWYPRLVIIAGALLVFFSAWVLVSDPRIRPVWPLLLLVVAMVGLISWLNIKRVKFCDQCDATLINNTRFKPMRFCPHCGAALEGKPSPGPDDEIA